MRVWTAAILVLGLAACDSQVEVPAVFKIAHGPAPAQRIECRQGECYWQQRQSTAVLEQKGDGVLVKMAGRSGNSTHLEALESGEYPEDAAKADVDWHPETIYFLCSLTHPAVLWESDGEFLLDKLKLQAPPGVQVAVANEYMAVCHSLAPGKWDARTVARLGYAEAASDQSRFPTLEAGLEAIGR
jgi:hypothetical protein